MYTNQVVRHLRARALPRVHAVIKRNPTLARTVRAGFGTGQQLLGQARKASGRGVGRPVGTAVNSSELGDQVQIEPEGKLVRSQPNTVEAVIDPIYRAASVVPTVARSVTTLPEGRVFGQVVVITADDRIVADVSRTDEVGVGNDGRTIYSTELPDVLPRPKQISGRVAVLTDYRAMGYGHWMMEVVPRVDLLVEAGLKMDDIDHFLVNGTVAGFQSETLKLLGIDPSKVVESVWTPHLQADELVVPSNCGDIRSPHPAAFASLRQRFGPSGPRAWGESIRIYVSRAETTHRRVLNESAVRQLLERHGFRSFVPERHSLLEKADLFSRAEAVVGPTGAGFTHLAFCQPGTKVVEFLNPGANDLYYWSAAHVLDLEYWCLSITPQVAGRAVDSVEDGEKLGVAGSDSDITVDLDLLRQTLNAAGLG